MRFTFDRDAMIKEVAIAQEIITNKSPISILSNIYMNTDKQLMEIHFYNLIQYVRFLILNCCCSKKQTHRN